MEKPSENQTIGHVEIRPEVNMLSVLRHLNYKAWFAIAEFIDNALQSYLTNQKKLESIHGASFKLEIKVQIDSSGPGRIVITDNAAGISSADFPRAFRAAQVPTNRSGLSEFGMGMKSAACWFSEKWSVRTKALDEELERIINFDIHHIVNNKIEKLDTQTNVIGNTSDHYTVVTLQNLHHIPLGKTVSKIKEHLESIYRVFLRDGRMILKVNNELLSFKTVPILNSPKYSSPGMPAPGLENKKILWEKEISFDLDANLRVKGFAALRETGSTSLAGFALFRRDRLIEGSLDETYRPTLIFRQANSYTYQRLFGELHLEGFEVSHTKDSFRWEEYEEVFLDALKVQLEKAPLNLLVQAENYRVLPSKKTLEEKVEVATASVADFIEKELTSVLVEAKKNPVEAKPLPESLSPDRLMPFERSVSINDGDWDWVISIRTSIDPAREDWISLAKEDAKAGDQDSVRRLVVELSLAHPFSVKFLGTNNENIELFLRIATSFCISLVLTEDQTGDPPEFTLLHFNQLMRGTLSNTVL